MGHAHLFFRLDLQRLKALFGSGDDTFLRALLKKQADEIEDNDACFEDAIKAGVCPNTEAAIREIVAGTFSAPRQTAMYGYALKILCEHLGKPSGFEVGSVGAHPYESQLARSGPPIPIPYDPGNFPAIGFLALVDIPAEIDRIDSAPRTLGSAHELPSDAGPQAIKEAFRSREFAARLLFQTDDNLIRDMDDYRKTLNEALQKRADIVSFRH